MDRAMKIKMMNFFHEFQSTVTGSLYFIKSSVKIADIQFLRYLILVNIYIAKLYGECNIMCELNCNKHVLFIKILSETLITG